MSTRALIGLGSNLGDRKAYLDQAIASLRNTLGVTVQAVSSYHATRPVGGPRGQKTFLNAACVLETNLPPIHLLRILQRMEHEAGRVRRVRWDERTLDLDLLLYGERILNTRELTLPHPLMSVRRFVLAPLAEIAPEAVDPLTRRTVVQLLANLDRRPSCVALSGFYGTERASLSKRIAEEISGILIHSEGPPAGEPDAAGPPPSNPLGAPREPELLESAFEVEPPQPTESSQAVMEHALEWWSQALDQERWSEPAHSDGWLVVDDWFDEIYATAYAMVPSQNWPDFRNRFLEARARIVAPTFVVTSAGHEIFLREIMPEFVPWHSPLGDAPILELHNETSEAEMVVKVLVTCQATRAG